jgi:cephalosporin hydroxylase
VNQVTEFQQEVAKNVDALRRDEELKSLSLEWIQKAGKHRYSYNFSWMGRPIIQHPTDMLGLQEIIWSVKPDLIIETGIAHGGSLIFSASMLELLGESGRVVGIDIDIRSHNRAAIESHPMSKRITMFEGSSFDPGIVAKVSELAKTSEKVMVVLDSNHTHAHVADELALYSPFVTKGSYLVVFDTIIEDVEPNWNPDRTWGKGNSPKTAVWDFLKVNDRFEIDRDMEAKLLVTVAPDGYLRCVKD